MEGKRTLYMTHRLPLLGLMALLAAGTAHAQLPRIVVQGTGTPEVFTDLSTAVAAAMPDDHLYLSGGNFDVAGDLVVGKTLHFVGAGIHPDSSSVTGVTSITTTGETQVLTSGSGSTFTGIKFMNRMQYGDGNGNDSPTGILFQRCEFVFQAHLGPFSETVIDECIFRHRLYGYDGTALVKRSIFTYYGNGTHQPIGSFSTGGLTMDHCTVIGGRVSNCANATLTNCVFSRDNAPVWQSNGVTMTNNLCVSPNLTSNTTPGATIGNVLNADPATLFVNETNDNYEVTDDIHLTPGNVGIGMATDGTNVGIYGTNSPYKPGSVPLNPHFRAATVAPATQPNGDLPVNIRVASQTH